MCVERPIVTARFWAWVNEGWVRISLKDGQRLRTFHAQQTEEGWYSEYEDWTRHGEQIINSWAEDGADCDGRYRKYGSRSCFIDELAAQQADGPPFPLWQKGVCGQIDHAAEAAGY